MIEIIQRDRESPAWTISWRMPQVRMFLPNIGSQKTVQQFKNSQIKGENQLNFLSEAMSCMTNKFDEYKRERLEKDKIIDIVKNDMFNMNEKIEKQEKIVGKQQQQQYLRRNCLLLHGIAEGERENTDALVFEALNEKIHVDFNSIRFRQNTRRIGQKEALSNKQSWSRAVIVKFASHNNKIINVLKRLKTFKRNTNQHPGRFNGKENRNFEGSKGKTPISQRVDRRW